MRTKITLVLVFLNVALFFFIFKFERTWRTERASLEARRRVLGAETTDLRAITVSGVTPGTGFTLKRRGEVWWLTTPLEWPANPHAVNSLVTELQFLEHVSGFNVADLAQSNQHLADYGIDPAKPRLAVELTSGEGAAATKSTLIIGDVTKDGSRLYLLSPDGKRVHVVNRSFADSLALPLDSLRADSLFTIPVFEARALGVQTPSVRLRIRHDSDRWLFDTIVARASKPAVELAITGLNSLHPKNFNPANPPATLPSAAPSLRLTLEGNNRTETLFLGDPVTAPATPSAPTDVEYYAQLDQRSALFTVMVPSALLSSLRNALAELREKRVLDFDPRTVTAITLTQPVLTHQPPLTLQRLEPPAGSASDAPASWQIVRRDATSQGPQTIPADRATVQRLLDQLAQITAKNFSTDSATNANLEDWGFKRPEREVTLTFGAAAAPAVGPSNPPLTLSLGTDTQRALYALVGPATTGSSIYAIDRAVLDNELPVAARAWRERQLTVLPPAARITALKLTDLTGGQTVLEVPIDANGHAPATTPHSADVEKVLAALRALQAKNFSQDGFTEKVLVGGDERTWRFKLDYTIALPGGAGAEQTVVKTLWFTDRIGGTQMLAGSAELDAVFEVEQPVLDALWAITYRDPGPPAPPAKTP